MVKKIAIYGTYEAKVPVRQRYWIRRKDGVKQRYWKTTTRMKKEVLSQGRFEFSGKGQELYEAMVLIRTRYVPRDFIDIPASEFLKAPEKYAYEGSWIEPNVES